MAKKYLKILSTRRTSIGVFRYGTIRMLDDSDLRVAKVIKALTDEGTKDRPKRPAAELISKKEAEAARAAVEGFEPEKETISATDAVMRDKAAVETKLAEAKKATAEMKKEAEAAKAETQQHAEALQDERHTNTELRGALEAANEQVRATEVVLNEAQAEFKKAEKDLKDQVKALEAERDDALSKLKQAEAELLELAEDKDA